MRFKTIAFALCFLVGVGSEASTDIIGKPLNVGESPGRDISAGLSDFKRQFWQPSKPYAAMLTTSPVRDGKRSLRVEVRYGDCGVEKYSGFSDCKNGNERVELSTSSVQREGSVFEYGWSVYFPEDFPTPYHKGNTRPEMFLGQFHGTGSAPHTWAFFYGGWRPGNGGLMLKGPQARHDGNFHGTFRAPVLSREEIFGRWNDIKIQVKWTKNSDGFLYVFVNDNPRVVYRGVTLPEPVEGVYLKLGIYRLDTKPSAGAAVIYYDRIYARRVKVAS